VAQSQADLGFEGLSEFMSEAQANAFLKNPTSGARFLGTAVHQATAEALEAISPGRFLYQTIGPDFLDTTTGEFVELTTPGQAAAHAARPGYAGVTISTYSLPPLP